MNPRAILVSLVACLWWALTFSAAGAQHCGSGACGVQGFGTFGRPTLQMHAGRAADTPELTFGSARPQSDPHENLRSLIPIAELANHPRLWIYTDQSMPRVYQGGRHSNHGGFHFAAYNISATGSEPHGNGNIEYPWGKPGGMDNARGLSVIRFVALPEGRPIVWLREPRPDRAPVAWRFPEGTIVGEVLLMRCQDGKDRPFEVRTRERLARQWTMDVFRPFPTAEHLDAALRSLPRSIESERLLAHLRTEPPRHVTRLPNRHPRQFVTLAGQRDPLPAVGAELQARLLTDFEFTSAHAEVWRGDQGFAPEGVIQPEGSDACLLEVSDQSCQRCHETTGMHVDAFQPGRDWYGYISGSDGIFTFFPGEYASVSGNGYPRHRQMRDIEGWVEEYDPASHPGYHPLEDR